MRIEITTTFDDLTKPEDEQRTEAGTKLTVTAERGAELVGHGLAVEIDAPAPKPAATKAPVRKRGAASPRKAEPQPVPAPAAADAAPANPDPITPDPTIAA